MKRIAPCEHCGARIVREGIVGTCSYCGKALDPFPLMEETADTHELPTVREWLRAGAPMREEG